MATLESRAPFSLVLVFGAKWLKCLVEEAGWSFTLKVHISLNQSLLNLHFLLLPASYTFLVLLGLFHSVIVTNPAHKKGKGRLIPKRIFQKKPVIYWFLKYKYYHWRTDQLEVASCDNACAIFSLYRYAAEIRQTI